MKMKPCADCGIQYNPWCMDFDHRPGEIKTAEVSFLRRGTNCSIDKIMSEIAKCDVVCSNCHRERSYRRWLKSKEE